MVLSLHAAYSPPLAFVRFARRTDDGLLTLPWRADDFTRAYQAVFAGHAAMVLGMGALYWILVLVLQQVRPEGVLEHLAPLHLLAAAVLMLAQGLALMWLVLWSGALHFPGWWVLGVLGALPQWLQCLPLHRVAEGVQQSGWVLALLAALSAIVGTILRGVFEIRYREAMRRALSRRRSRAG